MHREKNGKFDISNGKLWNLPWNESKFTLWSILFCGEIAQVSAPMLQFSQWTIY